MLNTLLGGLHHCEAGAASKVLQQTAAASCCRCLQLLIWEQDLCFLRPCWRQCNRRGRGAIPKLEQSRIWLDAQGHIAGTSYLPLALKRCAAEAPAQQARPSRSCNMQHVCRSVTSRAWRLPLSLQENRMCTQAARRSSPCLHRLPAWRQSPGCATCCTYSTAPCTPATEVLARCASLDCYNMCLVVSCVIVAAHIARNITSGRCHAALHAAAAFPADRRMHCCAAAWHPLACWSRQQKQMPHRSAGIALCKVECRLSDTAVLQ